MSDELMIPIPANALEIFKPEAMDAILGKIEEECRAFVPDMASAGGRKEIASLAYKVARTKSAIDDKGKELVEPMKAQAKTIDAERKKARDRLDALRDEVRAPLTKWENDERERVAKIERALLEIDIIGRTEYATTKDCDAAFNKLAAFVDFGFGDKADAAKNALELAGMRVQNRANAITAAMLRAAKEKAEREELERKARAEREEAIRKEAAENATREAEAKAAREAKEREEAVEREARRKLDEERRRADEAVIAAERSRIEAEQAARRERDRIEAEQKKADAERRAREADEVHRVKVESEAVEAFEVIARLLGHDLSPLSIVSAIEAGKIPHVTINF